jgi:hypothetical protein
MSFYPLALVLASNQQQLLWPTLVPVLNLTTIILNAVL